MVEVVRLFRRLPILVLLVFLAATTTTTYVEVLGAVAGFPKVLSVITTREITSQHSAKWDIKHKGSKRRRDINDETVQLRIIAHNEADMDHFDSLQQSGLLTYEVPIKDNEDTDNEVHRLRRHLLGISQDLFCYRTVEETYTSMDALAASFPNLVTIKSIGQSYKREANPKDGYDIRVMVIGDTTTTTNIKRSDMMVVGGHHSRELPPPETLMRWAEHLVTNYDRDADITWILQRTTIHVLPIANPDGRQIVQDHLGWYYRKNARPNTCDRGAQRYGVDLNRNYPLFWGDNTGAGKDPCDTDYHGSQPLSEPESYAIYLYANTLFDASIKKGLSSSGRIFRGNPAVAMSEWETACPLDASGIFIDVHSNGDFVYFPWGYRDKASPNHLPYLTASAKLAHPGNYQLWGPEQEGFLYFVSGDVTDTTYGIDCVFSVGYEIGSQMYANCTELKNSIVPIMEKSLLYAAKCASAPYQIPLGPDILKLNVDFSDPNRVDMVAMVSDEELIVDHAVYTETFAANRSQPIKEVRVYVNDHPFDKATSNNPGFVMNPLDGKYDQPSELAHLQLNMSLLPQGKHTLYFQATDTHNNAGPVSAVYIQLKRVVNFDVAALNSTSLDKKAASGDAKGGVDAGNPDHSGADSSAKDSVGPRNADQSSSQPQQRQQPQKDPDTTTVAANPSMTDLGNSNVDSAPSSTTTATEDAGTTATATTATTTTHVFSVTAPTVVAEASTTTDASSSGMQLQEIQVSSQSSTSSSSLSPLSSTDKESPSDDGGQGADGGGGSIIAGLGGVDQLTTTVGQDDIKFMSSSSSSRHSRSSRMVMMMSGLLAIPMLMTMGASLWLLWSALI